MLFSFYRKAHHHHHPAKFSAWVTLDLQRELKKGAAIGSGGKEQIIHTGKPHGHKYLAPLSRLTAHSWCVSAVRPPVKFQCQNQCKLKVKLLQVMVHGWANPITSKTPLSVFGVFYNIEIYSWIYLAFIEGTITSHSGGSVGPQASVQHPPPELSSLKFWFSSGTVPSGTLGSELVAGVGLRPPGCQQLQSGMQEQPRRRCMLHT